MSCGVGPRHGSDPTLLWLWRGLATTALIRPLGWEPSYAPGVALKRQKTKKKKKKFNTIGNGENCCNWEFTLSPYFYVSKFPFIILLNSLKLKNITHYRLSLKVFTKKKKKKESSCLGSVVNKPN